jgi:photosystem II stability/assembly factor-like uncharacterized protein
MKTTRLPSRQVLLLAISILALALPACSEIIVQQTNKASTPPVSPSPTTVFTQPPSTPTATTMPPTTSAPSPTSTQPPTKIPAPPTVSATAPSLPPASWQRISDLPRQINTLVVDPTNPQVIYAGTGDNGSGCGVYKSEDAGLTWRLASSGLPSEDVTALALSRDVPPTLYAAVGVRGDVFASSDGAQSWARVGDTGLFGGYDRLLRADPSDGRVLFAIAKSNGLVRSSDGGQAWLPVGEGLPGDEYGTFVLSLAIDPTDANVIYLGSGGFVGQGHGVYKSTDGGETWASANRGMIDYRITALAVDPARPQTVYAGGDAGELFKSSDGGQTWSDLTDALPIPEHLHSSIRDIVLDPAAPETVYLLCDYLGVLVSYDGGEKWRTLGKPGEPDNPSFTAMVIIFDPQPLLVVGVEREGGWRYATD